MARDIDGLLLESVRVRRRRLRDAFLNGSLSTRRSVNDNVKRVLLGVVVAALVCAICAGTSFIEAHLHDSLGPAAPPAPATLSLAVAATTSGGTAG